jgi:hypothetical protein
MVLVGCDASSSLITVARTVRRIDTSGPHAIAISLQGNDDPIVN